VRAPVMRRSSEDWTRLLVQGEPEAGSFVHDMF